MYFHPSPRTVTRIHGDILTKIIAACNCHIYIFMYILHLSSPGPLHVIISSIQAALVEIQKKHCIFQINPYETPTESLQHLGRKIVTFQCDPIQDGISSVRQKKCVSLTFFQKLNVLIDVVLFCSKQLYLSVVVDVRKEMIHVASNSVSIFFSQEFYIILIVREIQSFNGEASDDNDIQYFLQFLCTSYNDHSGSINFGYYLY